MRFTRDFYRPDGVVEEIPGIPGSEVWRYPGKNKPGAAVFGGKRAKPDWHYLFHNEEQREEKIAEWIENQKARLEYAKERRAKNNAGHTLKVGDVLHGSWGYDQTNASFYQIVEVPSKCYVIAREIGYKTVRESGSATYVVPVKDAWSIHGGEAKRYKAGPDNSITIESFLHPSKTDWDAEHYVTHWAYGH